MSQLSQVPWIVWDTRQSCTFVAIETLIASLTIQKEGIFPFKVCVRSSMHVIQSRTDLYNLRLVFQQYDSITRRSGTFTIDKSFSVSWEHIFLTNIYTEQTYIRNIASCCQRLSADCSLHWRFFNPWSMISPSAPVPQTPLNTLPKVGCNLLFIIFTQTDKPTQDTVLSMSLACASRPKEALWNNKCCPNRLLPNSFSTPPPLSQANGPLRAIIFSEN